MTFARRTSRTGREFSRCDDCDQSMRPEAEAAHKCPRDGAGTLWKHGAKSNPASAGGWTSFLYCTRCREEREEPTTIRDHACGPATWPELEGAVADALETWGWERQKEFALALIEDMRTMFQASREQMDMTDAAQIEAQTAYGKGLQDVASRIREMLEESR